MMVVPESLRRALRHDAVPFDMEPVRAQRALEHDLRSLFERVGNDAGVAGLDHVTVALNVEAVLQRVALAFDARDVAMELQAAALPRDGIAHHLVDVLVELRVLSERGEQEPGEGKQDHGNGGADFQRFSTHKCRALLDLSSG
jgi:hypothetical protein